MEAKLKYVSKEWARTKWRYRFQKDGRKATIRGEFGSPEFLAHYAELLGGARDTSAAPKQSIKWLVDLFLRDLEKRVDAGLASPLTLKGHKHHLARLTEPHGEMRVNMPRAKLIELLDQYMSTPGGRDNLRKSVSALYEWGNYQELIDCENPAAKIKKINTKSEGFYTCTPSDIETYMKHHRPGTMARRAMVLCLCATPRREDLRLLGPQSETTRNGVKWLEWKQTKAPYGVVEIPMMPMLANEVEGHDGPAYLLTSKGKPFTHGGMGNAFQKWFKDAGVRGSIHGVRKGVPSILTAMGVTPYELDILLGHELGSSQTKTYIKAAERNKIAATLSEKMARIRFGNYPT